MRGTDGRGCVCQPDGLVGGGCTLRVGYRAVVLADRCSSWWIHFHLSRLLGGIWVTARRLLSLFEEDQPKWAGRRSFVWSRLLASSQLGLIGLGVVCLELRRGKNPVAGV